MIQSTKEIKNPMVESKVMATGSVLTLFVVFWYLNHFNSNFDL